MARFTAARLVAALFLAAAGCGGIAASKGDSFATAGAAATDVPSDPRGGGDAGQSTIPRGGSGGDAGQSTITPSGSGGSGGSGGDTGDGTLANAAACPKAQPIAGSRCVRADDLGADGCHYPPPPPDCVSVIATCSSLGTWKLRLEPDYGDDTCSEEPESTCPDTLPAIGSACRMQGTVCQYSPGAIIICSVCYTWLSGTEGVDCEGAGGAPP